MDHALEQFIEGMGLFFEAEGMPRIAGRLFAYLLLREAPCSLDELTGELQVSKASISSNARLLEQQGMIQRVARPGDRRDYYVAAPDQTRTIELRLEGVRHLARLLDQALVVIPPEKAVVRRRLDQMVSINSEIVTLLSDVLKRRRATAGGD